MGRRPSSSSLSSMPAALLQKELRRRQRSLRTLARRRATLARRLAALDAQIVAAGGTSGKGLGSGRTRPHNTTTLVDALSKVLKGTTKGVSEAADAVLKSGYRTGAANFRVMVNSTLLKHRKRFKKVSRGMYTAA